MSEEKYFIRDLVIDDEYGIIDSKASIQEAAIKMKELGVPDLVVIDKSDKVLGVVADFDIVQDIVAEGKIPKDSKVLDAMYSITPVTLNTLVTEAFMSMHELEVNVVPVIDEKTEKLLGVATIQDCWTYIPDEKTDDVGMIPVEDPKNAEFWFAGICSILAFTLGILLPLLGIFGYFSIPTTITDIFGIAGISGEQVNFYLFDARGLNFFMPFINLVETNGFLWILIVINGFLVLITGIIGMFSLFYASYSDLRNVRIGNTIRMLPWLTVIFMIIEWLLFLMAFSVVVELSNVILDGVGLSTSILSMVLIIAALYRNYLFRQEGEGVSS
ncbi:MAG: CBS domain-containing protein [Promethearchaeota archaeon]